MTDLFSPLNLGEIELSNRIVMSSLTRNRAGAGDADAIAFGRLLLANPDLVERFRKGAPLNAPDYEKLYAGEEKGYTDYPFLAS